VSERERTDELDQIRLQMVLELDKTGKIDLRAWVDRYPHYAEELVEFAIMVEPTPDTASPKQPTAEETAAAQRAADKFMRQVESGYIVEQEIRLRDRLAAARRTVVEQLSVEMRNFRKAVTYTWVAHIRRAVYGSVDLIAPNKISGLLEFASRQMIFLEHQPYWYGLYDSELEKLAVEEGFLIRVGDHDLEPGPRYEHALKYPSRYLHDFEVAQEFVELLSRFGSFELETLSSVAIAAQALASEGVPISDAALRTRIGQMPGGKRKLRAPNFTPDAIADAVEHLKRLGLLPTPS
jgi:hypothetical protein